MHAKRRLTSHCHLYLCHWRRPTSLQTAQTALSRSSQVPPNFTPVGVREILSIRSTKDTFYTCLALSRLSSDLSVLWERMCQDHRLRAAWTMWCTLCGVMASHVPHLLAKHCGGIATKHGRAVLAAVSRFLHVWTSACHASAILRVKLNIEAAGS